MLSKLDIILFKLGPSQGNNLIEPRIVIFVDISNFFKTKSELIINNLLLATVNKCINKACEIVQVKFARFNQNRFDIPFIDKAFVIDNSNNTIFVCIVFLYGFGSIEHTKTVDYYIPLIVYVQRELSDPIVKFLCQHEFLYGAYFCYLFPDTFYAEPNQVF